MNAIQALLRWLRTVIIAKIFTLKQSSARHVGFCVKMWQMKINTMSPPATTSSATFTKVFKFTKGVQFGAKTKWIAEAKHEAEEFQKLLVTRLKEQQEILANKASRYVSSVGNKTNIECSD